MNNMSLKNGLQAMDVADFLRRHPQFLKQFPDLAMELELPREQGPASSLASYQVDVLRARNRELTSKLTSLLTNAGDNEQLMIQVHTLATTLLRIDSAAEVARTLAATLTEDFNTDMVRIVLFQTMADLPHVEWLLLEPEGAQVLPEFAEFLSRGQPLIGRPAADKLDYLFADEADQVQSAALLRLGSLGMLAIGSKDPARFHPGLGGMFLKLISETATAAFERTLAAA